MKEKIFVLLIFGGISTILLCPMVWTDQYYGGGFGLKKTVIVFMMFR